MEQSQIPSRSRAARRSATRVEEATSENAGQRFQELYSHYINKLQDIHQNFQRSYTTASHNYAETIQTELKRIGVQQPFKQYIEGVQTAWQQQDTPLYTETNRKYLEAMQETQVALQQCYEEAVRNYAEAMQQLWGEAQQQLRDAYLAYVQSLKDTWVQIDANVIDGGTLGIIAQSMLLVAACANVTVAPEGQI